MGDQFVATSFGQYFQDAFGGPSGHATGYIRAHYDVTGYCRGEGFNDNIIGRLCNAIVNAINKEVLLPKAIILIFENDLLNAVDHYNPRISILCGRLTEWLANNVHKDITSYKEKLPSKSRKFKYPEILWVPLPLHARLNNINDFRVTFNTSVQGIVTLFREMSLMPLDS